MPQSTRPPGDPHVQLPDGRRLAWTEIGDPAGAPVLYCHGFPGSRREVELVGDGARRAGVRLVAVDRPGFGGSDPDPRREILDWAADVAHLTRALGWRHFALVGASGGGPYAMACARAMPERVRALGLLCPLGPLDTREERRGILGVNGVGLAALRFLPFMLRPVLAGAGYWGRKHPESFLAGMARGLPPPDGELLSRPEVAAVIARSVSEAYRLGAGGPAREVELMRRPWGFTPGEIRVPTRLWHGERDAVLSVEMGRRVARAIPGCEANYPPDAGHFSLVVDHGEEVLRAMAEASRAPAG